MVRLAGAPLPRRDALQLLVSPPEPLRLVSMAPPHTPTRAAGRDWRLGGERGCNASAHSCHDNTHYPHTSPLQWAAFARAAAAPGGSHATPPTIFDINVVRFPPAYAVEGLHAFAQAGVPVKFVELGNELYDPKQNQGRFTTGAEYAAAMRGFEEAVAHAFPAAQIATVGCGASQHHGRAGARLWNAAALSHTSAGAATIHCYAELDDTLGIVASDAAGILQRAFAVAQDEADNIRETVPPHLRLWLTELGHIGNNRSVPQFATPTLDHTYLEGIFSAALLLLMVRVPQFDSEYRDSLLGCDCCRALTETVAANSHHPVLPRLRGLEQLRLRNRALRPAAPARAGRHRGLGADAAGLAAHAHPHRRARRAVRLHHARARLHPGPGASPDGRRLGCGGAAGQRRPRRAAARLGIPLVIGRRSLCDRAAPGSDAADSRRGAASRWGASRHVAGQHEQPRPRRCGHPSPLLRAVGYQRHHQQRALRRPAGPACLLVHAARGHQARRRQQCHRHDRCVEARRHS